MADRDLFAPPTKKELDMFAPPIKEELGPGYLESLARGGAQGGTLGFADEIVGAGGAAIDAAKKMSVAEVVKDYIANRDTYRKGDVKARKANPWTFGAGELGGGVATAFIPGMNVGKLATLGQRAAGAAGLGAVAGLGTSEADDIQGMARDTAIGGVVGGVAAPFIEKVVAPGVGAIVRNSDDAAGWAARKAMNAGFDVPEAVSKRYLKNPEAVNAAKDYVGMGQKLADTLGEVREDTGPLAEAALGKLSNVRHPNEGFDLNRALNLLNQADDPKAKELAASLSEQYAARSGGVAPEANAGYLTERELHDVKKTLQEVAGNWKSPLPPSDMARARSASGQLNETLKSGNEPYKEAISQVAENIQSKNQLAQKFGIVPDYSGANESGFTLSDRTISALKDVYKLNKVERRRILDGLRGQGYGNLADDIENTLAKETLAGGGRPNGSRKAVMFGTAGGAIGAMTGIPGGGWTGSAVGAAVGGGLDKYGPQIAKKAMDTNLMIRRLSKHPAAQKYVGAIKQAATRGQGAVAATSFLLQQTDSAFAEAVNNQDDD